MEEEKSIKEQIKEAEYDIELNKAIQRKKNKIQTIKDQTRMRDAAGRIIRKEIRNSHGEIINEGE